MVDQPITSRARIIQKASIGLYPAIEANTAIRAARETVTIAKERCSSIVPGGEPVITRKELDTFLLALSESEEQKPLRDDRG